MELNDLKEAWAALDNRLQRTEKLKESIILEMIKSKTGKSVNRFIIWEMFQTVVALLGIPFCVFQFDRFGGKYLAVNITLIFAVAICFFYTFWGIYKLYGLMKIDISKNVSNNIFYVNSYRIQLKRERKTTYLLWPILMILLAFTYASFKVTMPLWVFMVCLFAAMTLVIYWSYKHYDKSIDSILKSLDEIKELKE
jgi:hypothetical protein